MDYLKNISKLVYSTLKDTYSDLILVKKNETFENHKISKSEKHYTIKGLRSEFSLFEHLAGNSQNKVKYLILIESLPTDISINPKDEIIDSNFIYSIINIPIEDASKSILQVEVERI